MIRESRRIAEPVNIGLKLEVASEDKSGYLAMKRVVDFVVSSIFLLLLLPLFLVIAVLISLTSKGPVMYRSERIGYMGEPFLFPKFRSMSIGADKKLSSLLTENEKDGPIFKMKEDPRITPVGRFLRKYSLDELPQFICVWRGEMSLVGPRPPIRREVEQYDSLAMRRLHIKPGLTCFWQIMGRSDLTFAEMVDLDLRYASEMNMKTDFDIMRKTPAAVLTGKGAY
jgi:lipopolysaccharide/colanic/teichoic acid biosynthesis glycosyltransferase